MLLIMAFALLVVGLGAFLAVRLALMTRDLWRLLTRESGRARQRRLCAAARLTPDEAVAMAAATIDQPVFRDCLAATIDDTAGALVWRVDSMTFDMGVSVVIDDATSAVLSVDHWSGWPER